VKRILLVEDDKTLATTLRERLEREHYQVQWCNSLSSARAEEPGRFDLVVLDVGLPDGSGFQFAQDVRRSSQTPFIFVTAQSDAEARLKGYEIGAEEFIPKPFHLREFLLRVRHVLENHSRPVQLRMGTLTVDFQSYRIDNNGTREDLQPRDAKLLQLLVEKSPAVVSRDEILNQLWGGDRFPTARTVDNSVLRLRHQLGTQWGTCIQSIRGVGYRWSLVGTNA
jgi:two-component system phosphate regulon response regulator PhoB